MPGIGRWPVRAPIQRNNSERSEVYISVEGELQVILIGRFSPNSMFGTRN